jgi:hypothetical protein
VRSRVILGYFFDRFEVLVDGVDGSSAHGPTTSLERQKLDPDFGLQPFLASLETLDRPDTISFPAAQKPGNL